MKRCSLSAEYSKYLNTITERMLVAEKVPVGEEAGHEQQVVLGEVGGLSKCKELCQNNADHTKCEGEFVNKLHL